MHYSGRTQIERREIGYTMQIRTCTTDDIQKVRQFLSQCEPLLVHDDHVYWLLFHHYGETCFLLEEEGKIVGYISGAKSPRFEEVFSVDEIGVAQEMRGKGYSYLLLQKALEAAKKLRCTKMQMFVFEVHIGVVEAKDGASFHVISGFAKRHNLKMSTIYDASHPGIVEETAYRDTCYEIAI
jgi:GNAT superfamily N-acetyltransferase